LAILQCPACKSKKNYALYRWNAMPLGILTLPETEKDALMMPKYVIDLRRCSACGHVYHTEFDEKNITYVDDSTLVFNRGTAWEEHQKELAKFWIEKFDLAGSQIVEIGCGQGRFLAHFVVAGCEAIGFEPGRDANVAARRGIKVLQQYFQGDSLNHLKPKAILCRHVLEHLAAPVDFLRDIALTCSELDLSPILLTEVPRINKALEQHRISDFFYEHISHFTENSFRTLFEVSAFEVINMESRYGDEVITLAASPRKDLRCKHFKAASSQFGESVQRQIDLAQKQMAEWEYKKKKIALWGAAGKAAALINMLGFTKDRFPIVIDSDPKKIGYFVPGTGQEIRPPAYLKDHPVDGILICTNWRARDIETEIRTKHKLDVPLYVEVNEKIVELTKDLDV
jgi:2-polyprenyl-3-methyl-5-hydroxy-6-metoxy-1,4-benzoquinol methylase